MLGLAVSMRSRTSSTPARAAKYAVSSALKLLLTHVSVEDMYTIPMAIALNSIRANIDIRSATPFSRSRLIFRISLEAPFEALVI